MAKNSFSLDDLGALNLATGKVDEDKKRKIVEAKDRRLDDEVKSSFNNHGKNNGRQDKRSGQYNCGGGHRFEKGTYVGAPYNFVPIWDTTVSLNPNERVSHASTNSDLLSGEISYEITAKTPIMISDGKKGDEHFVKNSKGQYAIPGSSICGLIRSNVQILSLSSLADDIDDYSLMYREVGGAKETSMNKKTYDHILGAGTISVNGRSFSILKNVKAGYIENTGKGYVIYNTRPENIGDSLTEMNYYVLSERYVFEQLDSQRGNRRFEYMKKIPMQHEYEGHEFMEYVDESGHTHYVCMGKDQASRDKLSKLLKAIEQFKEARASHDRNMENEAKNRLREVKRGVRDILNPKFKPGAHRISYTADNGRIVAIGEESQYDKNGYLIISGAMQEKKALYIVPEIDKENAPIPIDEKDIKAYQIDYENKKNQLKNPKNFWGLPKNKGEIKPVFYVDLERLYFGFTPHLRLFYKESVHAGLGDAHIPGLYDYTKALFGFSNSADSYKSRVSFTDATVEDAKTPMDTQVVSLGGPKPTSYADYLSLRPDGKSHTYNDEDFRIRGVKQYWLRDKEINQNDKEYKENVVSKIKPLPAGTRFAGKVRYHNLRREELGLLIWALNLDKESEMNIGKGKPYGYGRIALEIQSIKKLDKVMAYESTTLILHPTKDITDEERDALVYAYKKEISEKLGLRTATEIESLPSIIGLMAMKDSTNLPNPSDIRYMDINKREYQNRRPLNTINDVLKRK